MIQCFPNLYNINLRNHTNLYYQSKVQQYSVSFHLISTCTFRPFIKPEAYLSLNSSSGYSWDNSCKVTTIAHTTLWVRGAKKHKLMVS